jgi:putative membrane protein
MASTEMESGPRFDSKGSVGDHFAWLRTRMALERTATSWVRTSVSLIGFGFTIVQFLERLNSMPGFTPTDSRTSRYVGLALIGGGVLVLVVCMWQYRMMIRYLWQAYGPLAGVGSGRPPHKTPVYAITIGMILVGAFAFVAIATRSI